MSVGTTSRRRPAVIAAAKDIAEDSQQEHIEYVLQHSDYDEIRRISCIYHQGVVVMHGQVSSFYLKQVAQTMVLPIAGVERIVNRLVVVYPAK